MLTITLGFPRPILFCFSMYLIFKDVCHKFVVSVELLITLGFVWEKERGLKSKTLNIDLMKNNSLL